MTGAKNQDVNTARPQGADYPTGYGERRPWQENLHQAFDSMLALGAIIILLPLMLLIAIAIRLDSPGSPIYAQLRVGRRQPSQDPGRYGGRAFMLYKFRTMTMDAEHRVDELRARAPGCTFFKLQEDPRVTRVGHLLRQTSLDELPQLFNVLIGDMRLVGNRPLPDYEAQSLGDDWQKLRFLAPAGITGLWQVSGRSDLGEHERMALDSYYSVSRSFWMDMKILLQTLPSVLARQGAK